MSRAYWLAALILPALSYGTQAAAQPEASLYEQGRQARISGDPTRAAALLGEAVRRDPRNADARLQLGLALLADGRLDAAEDEFRQVLALAPDYADARIGLARIAQRRGDKAAARALLEPVAPGNADGAALRAQLDAASESHGFSLDLDLSHSDLEEGQPDWREASLRASWRPDEDNRITAATEWARRFGSKDLYGELRLDRRLSPILSFHLLAGATPAADFRPSWQIGAGASLRVRSGANPTLLTLEGRQAHYRSGDIQVLNPGIEQYVAGGRAWLTARWINIFDEDGSRLSGWLARGDVQATPALRLFAGASDAPDTSEGVVTEIFGLFGGLSWDVNDRHVLRASIAHENRKGAADRLQLSIGMGVRF